MPTLAETRQRGAIALLVALGLALLVALSPYATGLIGIPVLYVALAPVHRWFARDSTPTVAAGLVVVVVLFLLLVPTAAFAGLIVNEAQQIAGSIMRSPIIARLSELKIGGVELGSRLGDIGSKLVAWVGSSTLGLVGSASRVVLNLTIALIGFYYLLLRPHETWEAVRPYIPFSAHNTEKLRQRFGDVTTSTLIGTGLSALVHGALVSLAFRVAGLPNAAFWGLVAMVFSILPVLGAGLVWGPAAVALLLAQRPVAAALMVLWGAVVVGNVDYLIRPMVSRRWGHIHPVITLLGALAGVPYFGLLGLLVGPLALSYFFELINMYREEYLGTA
ncbi:MAG TPA: AI-2E family transporter [Gemmatimonadales bacterium]|nr:AI-2E family transporter [Gemmatimonadales bacterium]